MKKMNLVVLFAMLFAFVLVGCDTGTTKEEEPVVEEPTNILDAKWNIAFTGDACSYGGGGNTVAEGDYVVETKVLTAKLAGGAGEATWACAIVAPMTIETGKKYKLSFNALSNAAVAAGTKEAERMVFYTAQDGAEANRVNFPALEADAKKLVEFEFTATASAKTYFKIELGACPETANIVFSDWSLVVVE